MASMAENKEETMAKEQSQVSSVDETNWKGFQPDMDKQIKLEKLRDAIASRDMYSLETAIALSKNIENLSKKENKEVDRAKFLLDVEKYRQRLMHAMGEDYPRPQHDPTRRKNFESLKKAMVTKDKDYETLNGWIDICKQYKVVYFQEEKDLENAKQVLEKLHKEGADEQMSEQGSESNINETTEKAEESKKTKAEESKKPYPTLKREANYKELISTMNEIKEDKRKKIRAALQQDIIFAESKAEQLKRKKKENKVLRMDKQTMTEMRRYNNPPWIIERLVQAVFLLLGEDIYDIKTWGDCFALLNPNGQKGLNKRVMELDVKAITKERYSSAKFLLDDTTDEETKQRLITLKDVQKVSVAGAAFYVWARGVIEDCEKIHRVQADEEYVPNHIKAMRHGKALKPKMESVPLSPRKVFTEPKKYDQDERYLTRGNDTARR